MKLFHKLQLPMINPNTHKLVAVALLRGRRGLHVRRCWREGRRLGGQFDLVTLRATQPVRLKELHAFNVPSRATRGARQMIDAHSFTLNTTMADGNGAEFF